MICIQDIYQIIGIHLVRNGWRDYVQRTVDFAQAFPRFSIMDSKTRSCIPEFLLTISRFLEGFAGYPTVMLRSVIQQKFRIIGLRNALRSIKTSCVFCCKLREQNKIPLFATFPPEKLDYQSYVFTTVGWIIWVRLNLNCYQDM